jgi:hypothetical protein
MRQAKVIRVESDDEFSGWDQVSDELSVWDRFSEELSVWDRGQELQVV